MRLPLPLMRFLLPFCMLAVICQAGPSAADECIANTWQQKADLPGGARDAAIAFSMNGKGYVAGGYSSTKTPGIFSDLWEYDPATNAWTRKADVPVKNGVAGGVGFSLNGYGYIVIADQVSTMQVFMYDPFSNAWHQQKDFPGKARDRAVAFVANGKAFMGLGISLPPTASGGDYLTDFWAYNPALDSWDPAPSFPGNGRSDGIAFSVNDVGFVGLGVNGNLLPNEVLQDIWSLENGNWKQRGDFPGGPTQDAVAFSVGPSGYVGTGFIKDNVAATTAAFWEYNPSADFWTQKTDFGGKARYAAVGFSIDTKGYVGTGLFIKDISDPSLPQDVYFQDLWSFCTGLPCIPPSPPTLSASYPPNLCTGSNGGFLINGDIGNTLNISVNGAPYYSGPSPFPGSLPAVPGTVNISFSQTTPQKCQSSTQSFSLQPSTVTPTPVIKTAPKVCTDYDNSKQTEFAKSTVTCTNCTGTMRYSLDNKLVAVTASTSATGIMTALSGPPLVGPHLWSVTQKGTNNLCTDSKPAKASFDVLECVITGR